MIVFVEQHQYGRYSELLHQTFVARRRVFIDAMGLDLAISAEGQIDIYDQMGAAYVLLTDPSCCHVYASLRLLPTTGPTSLGDAQFKRLKGLAGLCAPGIFECSRFCVDDQNDPQREINRHLHAASLLLVGLFEIGLEKGINGVLLNCDAVPQTALDCVVDEFERFDNDAGSFGMVEISDATLAGLRKKLAIVEPLYNGRAFHFSA